MLAASASAPNRQKDRPSRQAPKPANWRGVAAGMEAARGAVIDGDIAAAARHLKDVLEFAPNELQALELLGELLRQQGRTEAATRCFRKLEKLRSNGPAEMHPPVSRRLAQLHWQQGDHESARAMLALMLLRQPSDPQLQELRLQWHGEDA